MLHWLAAARGALVPAAERDGAVLVDLGCGAGLLAPHVAGKGYRHVGVDLTASALRSAAAHGVTAVRGDAAAVPLADGCADVVVAGEILEHVPDLPAAAREACRLLRPGGLLVIDTIAATGLARLLAITVAERVPGGPPPGIHDPALLVDRAVLVRECARHGVAAAAARHPSVGARRRAAAGRAQRHRRAGARADHRRAVPGDRPPSAGLTAACRGTHGCEINGVHRRPRHRGARRRHRAGRRVGARLRQELPRRPGRRADLPRGGRAAPPRGRRPDSSRTHPRGRPGCGCAVTRTDSLPLGKEAVAAALDDAGLDPADVGLFAVVSCTGYATPGLDIRIAGDLGMGPDVQRLVVGHMGCYAALPGLGAVADFVVSHDRPAAVLCLELTSLHVQPPSDDRGQLVTHALFGDAAVGDGGQAGRAARRRPPRCSTSPPAPTPPPPTT